MLRTLNSGKQLRVSLKKLQPGEYQAIAVSWGLSILYSVAVGCKV